MNWKQLHASATPEERLELLMRMMQTVEERQQRVVFTGRHWVRNRRRGYQAHFLRDRRNNAYTLKRIASLMIFGAILLTVSTATLKLVLHAPPQLASLALFFYTTSMLGVVGFRPYNLKFRSARSK